MNYVNVALGKPAYQSSISKWTSKFGAAGALKLYSDEEFGFHTECEEQPWWYVDLLCDYPIDRIVIHNRPGHIARTKTIKVETSIDFINWIKIHEGCVYFKGGDDANPFVLPLSSYVRARFVRLTLMEKEYFHLSRVEVFVEEGRLVDSEANPTNSFSISPSLTHERPKVAIVGTSNSIIKGYVNGLSAGYVDVVANKSVGSSHSTLIPYRLRELDKINFDVLIIDVSVNEQFATEKNFPVDWIVPDVIEYVCGWCAMRRVIPIVLILPILDGVSINGKDDVKLININKIIEICENNNVPFFNGYEFLNRLSEAWGRTARSCFQDSFHLNLFIARNLGFILSQRILDLFSRLIEPNLRIEIEEKEIHELDYLPVIPDENHPVITRTTSLLSEQFVRLECGKKIDVFVHDESEAVGIVFNMAQTNALLSIKGDFKLIKRLENPLFAPERHVWLGVWTLLSPVNTTIGRYSLECICANCTENVEDNEFGPRDSSKSVNSEAVVEIAGLILRKPKKNCPLLRIVGIDLNLTKKIRLCGIAPIDNKVI